MQHKEDCTICNSSDVELPWNWKQHDQFGPSEWRKLRNTRV